mgnify:CR=1 FL=1
MYQLGRKVATIIADGEVYWFVEKNLPSSILPDEWFNVAFRWRADLGVQVSKSSPLEVFRTYIALSVVLINEMIYSISHLRRCYTCIIQ